MTVRPVAVAIQLGCCPAPPRCALCAELTPVDDAPPVEALVHAARLDHPDASLEARFFGGPPPTADQVAALGGLPYRARVRPDLLDRATARRLAATGCVAVELDALTLDDGVLRRARRPYTGARVLRMTEALPDLGLAVGGVLSPGLPGQREATSLADAEAVAGRWAFARVHPARRGRTRRRTGDLTELNAIVDLCRGLLDALEAGGTEVISMSAPTGLPGGDHRSLRELVEARRMLDQLSDALHDVPSGAAVTVWCAPADQGRVTGPHHRHLHLLRGTRGLERLDVRPDPSLARGRLRVDTEAE